MMCRKVYLVMLFAAICLAGDLYGYQSWVVDPCDTSDVNWFDTANWNGGAIPTSTDWVDIDGRAPNFPDINTGTAQTQELRINPGWGDPNWAQVSVSGGNLDCYHEMYIGYDTGAGHDGGFILNSGAVRVGVAGNSWTMVGSGRGAGYLTINGGTFTTEILGIPRWWALTPPLAGGIVTLNGGELRITNSITITAGTAQALVDVAGGTLVWNGNQVATVQAMQTDGTITGYNFHVGLNIAYDAGTDKTTVTAKPFDPAKASLSYPRDAASIPGAERQSTILTWEAGIHVQDVNEHKVYFSDFFDDVNTGNPAVLTVRDVNNFDPGPLLLGQTYYWRVDEVNDANSDLWVGNVWQFSIASDVVVDDFESYINTADLQSTWSGVGITENLEGIITRDSQSMKLGYFSATSTATRTFTASQDWTQGGTSALTLYFYGANGNAGTLSVSITDADGDVSPSKAYPDSNDLSLLEWTEFNINLEDFNTVNVDLTRVKKVTISANGGSGTLYIDDVALNISRCVPIFAKGDMTGNCITNGFDLDFFSEQWLSSSTDIVPTAPSVGPHVWYDFNDGSGGIVLDSSGNGYNGTVSDGFGNWLSAGCHNGGCMNFDSMFVVYVGSSAFVPLDPNAALSISLWIKGDGSVLPDPPGGALNNGIMLHAGAADWDASLEALRVTCPQTLSNQGHQVSFYTRPSVSNGPNLEAVAWNTSNPDDWVDVWVHYAFIKDTPNSTMRIYRNGELVAENTDAGLSIGFKRDPANFKFAIGGARADISTTSYIGQIDDFQMYDYALSQAEVLYLAGVTGTFTQGLLPPYDTADISKDGRVNFYDYAVLAADWLNEVLWP